MRDKFGFEPRILSQPPIVAPGGMRQRYHKWTIFPPGAHRFRDAFLASAVQMIALGIGPDGEHKPEPRRRGEKAVMPMAGAFGGRRLVGPPLLIARKAKPPGDHGDPALGIKNIAGHAG